MTATISFKIADEDKTVEIPVDRIAYLEPQGTERRKEPNPPHTMVAITDQTGRDGHAKLTTLTVGARTGAVLKAIKEAAGITFVRVQNHDGIDEGYPDYGSITHTAHVNPTAVAKLDGPESDRKVERWDGVYEGPRWTVHFKLSEIPLPPSAAAQVCKTLDFDNIYINKIGREILAEAIRNDGSLQRNPVAAEQRP